MPERIDGNSKLPGIGQPSDDDQTWVITGSYKGEQVVHQRSISSLIEEAEEEATFFAGDRIQQKLTKRKINSKDNAKAGKGKSAQFNIKKVPDLANSEKLESFLEHIRDMTHVSSSELLEEAGRFFKDVSHQYAALAHAKDMLEQDGGRAALVSSLENALEEAMEAHGPEIRAGLNVTETARDACENGFGSIQDLRDFYRETILNFEDLNQAYKNITENADLYICSVCGYTCRKPPLETCPTCGSEVTKFLYNKAEFEKAVEFLIKAVGCDLQSQGPSISPVELKKIIDDLYQLELLGNIHRDCFSLYNNMQKTFNIKLLDQAQHLMDRLMVLKESTLVDGNVITQAVTPAGLQNIEAKIYLLRELVNLIKKIPLKAYGDLDTREKLIDAAQDALDTAIYQEAEEPV